MIGLVLFALSWSFNSVLDCIRFLLLWHESLANKILFLCFCAMLAQKSKLVLLVRYVGTIAYVLCIFVQDVSDVLMPLELRD